MKASEFIKVIEKAIVDHGDLELLYGYLLEANFVTLFDNEGRIPPVLNIDYLLEDGSTPKLIISDQEFP
jgi:hypothetical protein